MKKATLLLGCAVIILACYMASFFVVTSYGEGEVDGKIVFQRVYSKTWMEEFYFAMAHFDSSFRSADRYIYCYGRPPETLEIWMENFKGSHTIIK
jgi:hypothetical protein